MTRRLRSGYTTGACAAAAAKAAVGGLIGAGRFDAVEIPFPDGGRHVFSLYRQVAEAEGYYQASVIKDAGDDPDVTNGAEIVARARFLSECSGDPEKKTVTLGSPRILLAAGHGVGLVTRPGLAIEVGEPAINPGPRRMISEAIAEILVGEPASTLEVEISIPGGEELAIRTLNHRLGIVGGLSVLGSSGIVKPVSAAAWTATIKASLNVARESGLCEVVLSTGRRSEKGVREILTLPEEACAMMGDYLEFSLQEAAGLGFGKIHLAGMWAKIMKAALEIPQTHVRNGALEVRDGAKLLERFGASGELLDKIEEANTARQIHEILTDAGRLDLVRDVCRGAKNYAVKVAGVPVAVYLVGSSGRVEEHV